MTDNKLENIYNFLQLSDLIATSGQPTVEQFSAIKDSGYQVVINLALSESTNALPNEPAIVEGQGMEYIHIPVVWEKPLVENFQSFLEVMEANADRRIFVHCAANKRVSAFMYLYRLLRQGISEEEAQKDLEKVWVPNPVWQDFIDRVKINLDRQYKIPRQ
ncbi:MAG: protein tyrosine phosphatase family protein [Prochloraceae cyanobacterium]